MATFGGVPHVHKYSWTYPSGIVKKYEEVIPTAWNETRSKNSDTQGGFIPGVFSIKPYSVSRTFTSGQGQTLTSIWKAQDGVVYKSEFILSDHCRADAYSGIVHTSPDYVPQMRLAWQECMSKLNESQWDAAMDLAEIGGTLGLVASAVKALANGTKGIPGLVKRLLVPKLTKRPGQIDFKRTVKSLQRDGEKGSKAAADAWLTWRYGVMPIVLSIQDLLELLKTQLEKAGTTIRTKRRRPSLPAVTKSWKGTVIPVRNANYVQNWEARVEAIVYYQRHFDMTLKQALGFAPENLPNLLWELTTLSFVWDWFFHLGDFLSALKPKVGMTVLGTTVSLKTIGKTNVIQQFQTTGEKRIITASPFTYQTESFQRIKNPAYGSIPVFTGLDDVSVARWADAASLALKPTLKILKQTKR